MNDKLVIFEAEKAINHKVSTPPNVVEGEPVTNVWQCFISDDGKTHAGFWSCENGAFCIESHTSTEMCTILEGEATVVMADGEAFKLKAGDSIAIPYGIKNTWYVPKYIRKSYICYLP